MALVPVNPGETYFFQAWHRDVTVLGQTSNFTTGVQVGFN